MPTVELSEDAGFDFALRCLLSGAGYALSDPGEVLAVADQVVAGDRDSWFDALGAMADRCETAGHEALGRGHRRSAGEAFLRAANYRYAAFYHALGTREPARAPATWRRHRTALERAFACREHPPEEFDVTVDGCRVRAWLFTPGGPPVRPRPVVIVHNLLTGPLSDVLMTGVDDSVGRGWAAVAFEGPGQGASWFEDGVGPVDDWAPVATAVTDRVVATAGVDPDRVVAMGIGDGGYLAARHAAVDHRLAALVCDPGVVRVVDGALGQLPDPVRGSWSDVDVARGAELRAFDAAVSSAAARDPELAFTVAKLTEQWPTASLAEVLARMSRWELSTDAGRIACPTWIADPDAAVSFPGQSAELAGLLGARADLVAFTSAEGAGLDCEIGAPRLRNQRAFDWLDDLVGHTADGGAP